MKGTRAGGGGNTYFSRLKTRQYFTLKSSRSDWFLTVSLGKTMVYTWHFYMTSPSQPQLLCNPFHIRSKTVISINHMALLFPADSSFFVLCTRHPCLWIMLSLYLSQKVLLPQLSTNLGGIYPKCTIPIPFPHKSTCTTSSHFPCHPSVFFKLWNSMYQHFKT